MVLIYSPLMTSDVEHVFTYLLVNYICSLENAYSGSFPIYKWLIWGFCLFFFFCFAFELYVFFLYLDVNQAYFIRYMVCLLFPFYRLSFHFVNHLFF